MSSSLGSAELRYNRSHAALSQRHGAPPKIMPQSDISFHSTANCDLLIRQSNSGFGSRQKNLTTLIPTPESANFSLLTLIPLPTPPSVSGLSNLLSLYQIIKHEKIQAVFPNVETILRLFLCLMVTNCSGEISFSKLKRIRSVLVQQCHKERLSDLGILYVENDKLRLIDLMTPLTNSQPGKLEWRCFDNKLPTCRNYILANRKCVKSLSRLTCKHENLITDCFAWTISLLINDL